MKPTLSELRARIDALDDEIAALLQQRLALVKSAADLKHQSGEGTVSSNREHAILQHGAELERKYDLPLHLMQDLQRRILRHSYVQQGSGTYQQAHFIPSSEHRQLYGDDARCRVCIVGGNGGMGRLFARYLEGAGYLVSVVEVADYAVDETGQKVTAPTQSRAAQRLQAADWVIISVPIAVTETVIEQVAPLLRPDCILSDFTSIKERPVAKMLACHPGPVCGLHPMFGPDTFSLVKQVVVTVVGRAPERTAFIGEQLRLLGASVVPCSGAEHDEAMRVIQALRHFTTISYGNFLREAFGHLQPTDAEERPFIARLLDLSSPIYHLELMMVGRLFAQDPHLYCDIISASCANLELIAKYVACAGRCLATLEHNDQERFIADFKDTTAFFGPFARKFLQESSDILALVQDTYPVAAEPSPQTEPTQAAPASAAHAQAAAAPEPRAPTTAESANA